MEGGVERFPFFFPGRLDFPRIARLYYPLSCLLQDLKNHQQIRLT
jgi:hypothetical protein